MLSPKTSNRLALSFTSVALLASLASAAPVQRADVSAEAAWVVHVDFDKLRSTALGQFALEELKKPENDSKLGAFTALTGVDPRQHLHGATLYSPSNGGDDAVGLIYADFDADRLVNIARGAKEYEAKDYQKHVIHSWLDEKKAKAGGKPRTYAAIHGKRVLFAQKESSVRTALDVLDARVGNLAKSSGFPQLGTADDAFVQAAARKFPVSEGDPNAAVLKQSKAVELEVAEAQKQVAAKLKLEADGEEVARNIASVGQGLIGLLRMQKEKPIASRLGEAMAIQQQASAVQVNLKIPSTEVIDLLKSAMAGKAGSGSNP